MTPAAARTSYRRQLQAHGEPLKLKRGATEVTALGKITGYAPNEIVGGISQGDQRVILLAEDLETAGFPGDPKPGDKILQAATRPLNVQYPPVLRRVAGVTIAYELTVRG